MSAKGSKHPIRAAKAAGISAQRCWDIARKAIEDAAELGKWRPSERAASLAFRKMDIIEVYGKKATKDLTP
jgi:hypothetical protein